ncbi:MAG TPA: ABC transporter ATP-binding protein [Acidimicrobiia bacterium]|nr:ABC transporter ATP-binding protein [Acidimicrobiia bacterium]
MNRRAGTQAVTFEKVKKTFDTVVAVDDVDLAIADGEFFAMLGPSGSGKTTCLRMIAGFELPTSGRILLHGDDVSGLPPYDRDVNTVFQDYALFPHMSVADNVGYSLMVRKTSEAERKRRVEEALALVRLEGFGSRKPSQLSGGQRQRVALARALINRPSVLLLDEPLGALDLKLRQAMQTELKALQREVGITFIFVTHDQEEALTMSDRLAVFNHGRVEQVGRPAEVYESPVNSFVAGFVGTSNIITGELALRVRGIPGSFTVRPEKISVSAAGTPPVPGTHTIEGTVIESVYMGAFNRLRVAVPDGELLVTSQNLDVRGIPRAVQGQRVALSWDEDSSRPLAETEKPAPALAGANE